MCGGLMAQNQIETYSIYDVNHQDGVNVADATRVVSRAIEQIKDDPQVVDAAALNALLLSIDQRLSAIESKLGIETPNTPEDPEDYFNGHEYVDLGLKDEKGRIIYWATCNLGATSPKDAGLYFAWGATDGYGSNTNDGHIFNWENAPFNNGSSSYDEDYFNSVKNTVCPNGILDCEYDAAVQNWEGSWRMPTREEMVQLQNECTWVRSLIDYSYTVTGPNGNFIVLPASGKRDKDSLTSNGSEGYYWSSSLDVDYCYAARCLYCGNVKDGNFSYNRRIGLNIRPVCVIE